MTTVASAGGSVKYATALILGIGCILLLNHAIVRQQFVFDGGRLAECHCPQSGPDALAHADTFRRQSKLHSEPQSLVNLKRCILATMTENTTKNFVWNNLQSIVSKCTKVYAPKLNTTGWLQLHMGRFGEIKYFLPPRDNQGPPNCNWLTIGIGGDTQVESEFAQKFPQCKLFGIEPMPDQAADFAKYGKVLSIAAGKTPGEFQMRVRQNKGARYTMKKVSVVPLHEVMDANMGTRTVHFATLDIEGFEYVLLEALRRDKKLGDKGIVFCQLDVELHNAELFKTFVNQLDEPGGKFEQFLQRFLENTDYVPVMAEKFLSHRKLILVNPSSKICRDAFDFELA